MLVAPVNYNFLWRVDRGPSLPNRMQLDTGEFLAALAPLIT
jgi:hypothetical protein